MSDLHDDPAALPSADQARHWAGTGLVERLQAMQQQLHSLAASARVAELQMRTVAACLAGDQTPATHLEVSLSPAEFDTACVLVEHLQHQSPELSVDDCMNEIFTTGLVTLAYRLIP